MKPKKRITQIKYRPLLALIFVAAVSGFARGENRAGAAGIPVPAHPRVWEDEALESLELPLADPAACATYLRARLRVVSPALFRAR
jgi:hypothetical protein